MTSNEAPTTGCVGARASRASSQPRQSDSYSRRRPGRRGPALAALVLAATCGLTGCAFHKSTLCGQQACSTMPARPHVEIVRGLAGYMPGVDELQCRLAARGITSTTACCASAHQVSQRLLDRRARGDQSPIVLMGYAVGGGGVRKVARDLAEHGVCVDAIILIDPSFFEPVPRNVRYAFVAYRPETCQKWNPIMRGCPVRVESNATVVNKVNLDESAPQGVLDGECHLTITSNAWVQELLANEAAAVFAPESSARQSAEIDATSSSAAGASE